MPRCEPLNQIDCYWYSSGERVPVVLGALLGIVLGSSLALLQNNADTDTDPVDTRHDISFKVIHHVRAI